MSYLNISPIDGRYNSITNKLSQYFSEYALMKYRVNTEIKYFLFLSKLLGKAEIIKYKDLLTDIINTFNIEECKKIKILEKECKHDVKAVEYYLAQKLKDLSLHKYSTLLHFGLTSQDVNNTAITISLQDYIKNRYIPKLEKIITTINEASQKWHSIAMLCRTHGQAAVPSTLGKEIRVFSYRLEKQLLLLKEIKYYGKFGGAVGNLNAHYLAYPGIDWTNQLNQFLATDLHLIREQYTTQIDNYENLAVLFDCIRRINTILIDMDRDIWQYIAMDYLSQTFKNNEVGSSTMPQKINPINFENSEGNLLLANSQLDFMSNKLPVSRLQRDLTDSTVLRNIGTIFGHIEIAYHNFLLGFAKICPNEKVINKELNSNLAILSEAVQTILRRAGVANAYEIVKEMCRGKGIITPTQYIEFINSIRELSPYDKNLLIALQPENYIGCNKID